MGEDTDWFEETWRYRDYVLYPQQFRSNTDGLIITIPSLAFAQLGVEEIDPRWLHCGVLKFRLPGERAGVACVTSGLSNAWDDERPDAESISGLGIELRIDNAADEDWAVDVLLRLAAMQLLIGAGRLPGARLLGHGDRVRVGADTFGNGSSMTSLLATKVVDLQLASGTFQMIRLFAITGAERELGSQRGAEALIAVLRERTSYPVNNIARQSVV